MTPSNREVARGPAARRDRSRQYTILLVDDHALLRSGLTRLIEGQSGFRVCGQAASGQDGLRLIEELRPDLAIVDIELGPVSGLELIRQMKTSTPGTLALVLSMHEESAYGERALQAGARGYICKAESDVSIMDAIQIVLDGELYMSRVLASRLAARYVDGRRLETDSALGVLSNRELQVFELIGRGQTSRQVAAFLNLSIKTVESHREHIKQKLSVVSASDLVRCAIQWVESRRLS